MSFCHQHMWFSSLPDRCFFSAAYNADVTLSPSAFQNEENKNMNTDITLILSVGLFVWTKADAAYRLFNVGYCTLITAGQATIEKLSDFVIFLRSSGLEVFPVRAPIESPLQSIAACHRKRTTLTLFKTHAHLRMFWSHMCFGLERERRNVGIRKTDVCWSVRLSKYGFPLSWPCVPWKIIPTNLAVDRVTSMWKVWKRYKFLVLPFLFMSAVHFAWDPEPLLVLAFFIPRMSLKCLSHLKSENYLSNSVCCVLWLPCD